MSSNSLSRTVRTQAELDTALADKVREINIASPAGVWLEISDTGSASVSASGSASVRASGSASVRAFDSASVSASGSASVRAFGSASVSAFGSASVRAFGSASVRAFGSASVRAFGSASVRAFDSASVRAFDSASVRASGSASVRASGSASVRAFDSASVSASGSASVSASGSASVRASKYVAIHLHSQRVTITGDGHIIDITGLNLEDSATWCDYHGIEVEDDVAYVYKAVGDDWKSQSRTPAGDQISYRPGATPEAPDWNTFRDCGGGLHFSPTPHHALAYRPDATRFLRCGVRLDELVTLNDKVKAKRVVDACVEVDEHARIVAVAA